MKATPYNLSHWKRFFFTIWGGQAASLFGSTLVEFTLIWYMTKTTGSAIVLTTATLVVMIPRIFLTPIIGSLVDRFSRRTMIILADSTVAVFTLLIAALFWTGSIQLWHIYLLSFVRSVAGTAHHLSMQAATSLMVPEKQLSRVAGFNQALFGAMNVLGPPAGALLLEVLPIYGVLSIDIVTALIAVLPILLIVLPEPAATEGRKAGAARITLIEDLVVGFRYVKSWKGLLGLMVLATTANFLMMPVFSLIPLLVTRHFGGAALQLGWVDSVLGAGTIAGGLILGAWGGFHKRILTAISGGVAAGLGVLLVAFAPANAFWFALGGFAVFGISLAFIDGPIFALLQVNVEPEMQGRVFSFLLSAAKLSTPFSLLIAGPVAELAGIRFWFYLAGAGGILVHLIGAAVPVIRNIEERAEAIVQPSDP